METHVPVKVQSLRDPHEGGGHRKRAGKWLALQSRPASPVGPGGRGQHRDRPKPAAARSSSVGPDGLFNGPRPPAARNSVS